MINKSLIAELQYEADVTKKLLERVPEAKFDYKPHDKSMTLNALAIHLAEIPAWIGPTVESDGMDFGTMEYKPPVVNTTAELLKLLDDSVKSGVEALNKADDATLTGIWTAKNKGVVIFEMPRIQVIRGMIFNHLYHHRGQLTVYLRMLDVALPQVYGPTADEQ